MQAASAQVDDLKNLSAVRNSDADRKSLLASTTPGSNIHTRRPYFSFSYAEGLPTRQLSSKSGLKATNCLFLPARRHFLKQARVHWFLLGASLVFGCLLVPYFPYIGRHRRCRSSFYKASTINDKQQQSRSEPRRANNGQELQHVQYRATTGTSRRSPLGRPSRPRSTATSPYLLLSSKAFRELGHAFVKNIINRAGYSWCWLWSNHIRAFDYALDPSCGSAPASSWTENLRLPRPVLYSRPPRFGEVCSNDFPALILKQFKGCVLTNAYRNLSYQPQKNQHSRRHMILP